MAVFNMKPHILSYLSKTDGYRDENGDWHKGTETWVSYCRCDAVPAGKENMITYADGSVGQYNYTVSNLPKDCREFKFGDRIKLTFYNQTEKEFDVKGFHRYQLQSVLYV